MHRMLLNTFCLAANLRSPKGTGPAVIWPTWEKRPTLDSDSFVSINIQDHSLSANTFRESIPRTHLENILLSIFQVILIVNPYNYSKEIMSLEKQLQSEQGYIKSCTIPVSFGGTFLFENKADEKGILSRSILTKQNSLR